MRSTGPIVLLLAALGLATPLTVAAQNVRSDPSLRVTLENAYHAWRAAMAAEDLERWEKTTAFSRQIRTKNRIVSQRLPFPEALFRDPVQAPTLHDLTGLGVLTTGRTATSTYFGKANFGPAGPDTQRSANLLVLHFLNEDGTWKFDRLRVVKPGNDGEILLQIRNGDFSFLEGEEFQPADQLPPVPQPVSPPEFVAEAWIDSSGYEVTLEVNDRSLGTFTNARTSELVIGGLRRGQNSISLTTKRLTDSGSRNPKVEIAIYATEDPAGRADRAYHFRPGSDPPREVNETFVVD